MTVPDLASYRAVHLALRGGAHALADAAGAIRPDNRPRVAALARYWEGYSNEVLLHHRIEDDTFFPALAARVPVAGTMIDRTDAEHHELDEIMDRCTAAVRTLGAGVLSPDLGPAFAALAAHMAHHLDFEDDEILPLFERHFSHEEFDDMEQVATKSLGLGRQAAFTVPFLAYWVAPDVRDALLAGAPLPFRILYRATRRGHAKLAGAVFGVAPVAAEAVRA